MNVRKSYVCPRRLFWKTVIYVWSLVRAISRLTYLRSVHRTQEGTEFPERSSFPWHPLSGKHADTATDRSRNADYMGRAELSRAAGWYAQWSVITCSIYLHTRWFYKPDSSRRWHTPKREIDKNYRPIYIPATYVPVDPRSESLHRRGIKYAGGWCRCIRV